jgi:diguanylate cyclase (GGDEF)-like protein
MEAPRMHKNPINRISLTRQSLVFSIIVILFLSLSNGILIYYGQIQVYETKLSIEDNLCLKKELSASKTQIQSIKSYIYTEMAMSEVSLREKTKSMVEESHRIALSIYEMNKDEMDETILKNLIKNVLESSWQNDSSNSRIIGRMDGTTVIFNSLPGSNASSQLDLTDIDSVYPIHSAIEIASSVEKEGFIEWNWHKSDEASNMYNKIGYVMYFEPYDWFIGSGEYLYNAENDSKLNVLETIKKIYVEAEPYVFIGNSDGTVLMAPYEMDNFYDLGKSGNTHVWDIIKNLNGDSNGYVNYTLPDSSLGYSYSKTSYVLHIPEWDWYLGSGINLDALNAQKRIRNEELKSLLFKNYTLNIILSLAAFGVAIYLFAYYNKNIDKEFKVMNDFFSSASEKYSKLNASKFKYREFFNLATTANEMINEIHTQKVELEKYSEKMNRLAQMDSLTMLLNHRAIMESIQNRINEADRYHAPFSAIMLDIDNFKLINDTYGHPFGDTVLVRIASIFKESLRDTDIIGRYGGEEFLILLPNTNLDDAWLAAEKIRKSVETAIWKIKDLRVTISGGISEYSGEYTHTLVGDADQKLYRAKSLGKNRMVK